MSDKRWKKFEREVAKDFETERTPLSGSNSKQTNSDTLSDTYFIECKYKKKMGLFSLWKSVMALAGKEGKIPLLALKEKHAQGYLLVGDKHTILRALKKGKL